MSTHLVLPNRATSSLNPFPITTLMFDKTLFKNGILRALALPVIMLTAWHAHATILTVSNFANHPAQYTSVQTAIDNAAIGDTILIAGSPNTYNDCNVTKQLTLIGAGHNSGDPSTLLNTLRFYAGSDNSTLLGLHCSNVLLNISVAVQGLRIERCRINAGFGPFNTGLGTNDLIIRNCVFSSLSLGQNCNNIQVTNNIISNMIMANNATNLIISHNLFLSTGTGEAFSQLSSGVISDNIFWGRTPVQANVNYCIYNNNITYQTTNDVIPFGTNTGSNNQVGVNPLFVDAPNRTGSLAFDYHLQASSPGHNAATDGTDIGVFGGAFPFVDLTGRPRIPLVTTLNILNSSITQGGSLNVEISGTKVD